MTEDSNKASKQLKTCFVVGPIGASSTPTRTHADWLLNGIIKPTFSDHFSDFEVIRSDTISSPGMIDTQMITHLLEAELVIVDMSLLNANAFYEMGIRHMVAKPVIHMFLEGTEIPFDVKPYRAIPFQLQEHFHLFDAQKRLASAVSYAVGLDYVSENPVTKAKGFQQFEQAATPADRLMLHEMEALRQELNILKRSLEHGNRPNLKSISGHQQRLKFDDDFADILGRSPISVVQIDGYTTEISPKQINQVRGLIDGIVHQAQWVIGENGLTVLLESETEENITRVISALRGAGVTNIKVHGQ